MQSIKKKGKARHCGGMNVPRIEDRGLRNSKLDFHPSFARSENFTRSFFFFVHRYIYSSIELCSKSFFLFFNSFVTSIERIIQRIIHRISSLKKKKKKKLETNSLPLVLKLLNTQSSLYIPNSSGLSSSAKRSKLVHRDSKSPFLSPFYPPTLP